MDTAQFDGFVSPDQLPAEHESPGDRRGELVAHDFDRADRVGHADADLGEPHL